MSRPSFYTVDGVTKSLTEWAKDLGVNKVTLTTRLKKGMSLKEAFTSGKMKQGGDRTGDKEKLGPATNNQATLTTRRCRKCKKPLPSSRYFNCTKCVPELGDDYLTEKYSFVSLGFGNRTRRRRTGEN